MSQGAQVDYDALARQYGASSAPAVDYDALAAQHGGAPSVQTTNTVSAGPKPFTLPWLKAKAYTIADEASQGLPAAGATAGAMIGAGAGTGVAPGPGSAAGAVGGAGIGGMAGEAARQLIRRALGFDAPDTSQQAAADITKQGIIQGGVQAGAEALPLAAPEIKKAALGQYERALAPTTRINKAITQKIAPEMIDRSVTGSLPSIESQAEKQTASLRPQLDAAYNAIPPSATQGSGKQVIDDLERMKGRYMVAGQPANPAAVNAISGVQDIVRQYGNSIAPQDLRQLKQIFDEPVAARGGYAGGDLTTAYTLKAQKAAANSIRNILHQASPDAAALDKTISFWLDVQRVARHSGLRQTGQAGGLVKTLWPLVAGAAGGVGLHAAGAGGNAGLEAAGGVVLAELGARAVRSPMWRTMSAVTKNAFADALARGDVGQVAALATRFGLAASTMPPQSAQGGLPTQQ